MAEELSEETKKELMQLQNTQRQLQLMSNQRQRYELEVIQADAALAELEKAEGKAYKAVGTFLVEGKPKELIKDLNEKRKDMNAKIETLKKQEERLRTKAEEAQKKIEKQLGTNN